jgi:hypothetical protein
MNKMLTNTTLLFAATALYAAGFIAQSTVAAGPSVAPTSLSVDFEGILASGPTLPPDDYDDPNGGTKVASGPTLPPDDYDDPNGGTKVASGPTLPPDDYDDPNGGTKVV